MSNGLVGWIYNQEDGGVAIRINQSADPIKKGWSHYIVYGLIRCNYCNVNPSLTVKQQTNDNKNK